MGPSVAIWRHYGVRSKYFEDLKRHSGTISGGFIEAHLVVRTIKLAFFYSSTGRGGHYEKNIRKIYVLKSSYEKRPATHLILMPELNK